MLAAAFLLQGNKNNEIDKSSFFQQGNNATHNHHDDDRDHNVLGKPSKDIPQKPKDPAEETANGAQ